MEFCFSFTVAESLQAAQGTSGYGSFLYYVMVKSQVVINVEAEDLIGGADWDRDWVLEYSIERN